MKTRSCIFVIILLLEAHSLVGKPNKPRLPASCMNFSEELMLPPPERPEGLGMGLFDLRKMHELVPMDIKKDESGTVVISKIADRGFQKIMSSDQFKASPLGSLNQKVQEQTRIELALKPEGQKIEHKVKAQVLPFQGGASLSYTGYIGVDLSFQPVNDTQKIKIEDLVFNKKVYYERTQGPFEQLQQVGVRWNW